jgi:hypothetical protein
MHKTKLTLRTLLLFILFLSISVYLSGQTIPGILDSTQLQRKTMEAVRITNPPKIDGIPDEAFWKTAPSATEFVEYTPRNGIRAPFATDVRFVYDDIAVYALAIMYDPNPDSIFSELGRRDQVDQLATDYISFDILPYNDGLNMYEFKVTPDGLQNDCKYSAIGQDVNWDAVWESAARITDSAWIVEAKFPYSALRFPKVEKQVWGINFWRNLYRKHEWSTWCYVDNKMDDIFKYYGEIKGIDKINPPLRLSLTPYVAGYVEKDPGSDKFSSYARGGMDARWGLNESYTLDMMLIPDFGQVQADDKVLNLSPFELRYDEKRQFFTEGTELFNKCEIFYTRRIGSTPRNFFNSYGELVPDERVKKNPDETRIINATKLSGRNAKGLGVGFFNAITTNTWSVLEDTLTGETRKVLTQPFTNYNVLVLDQNLKHNSYISLINTNYFSPKDNYFANVTGTETKLNNRKNTFAFFGRLNISNKSVENEKNSIGHNLRVSISKPGGKFTWQFIRDQADKKYDPNDMGFLNNNNYISNSGNIHYTIRAPFWKFLNTRSGFGVNYNTLYERNKFKELGIGIGNYTQFKNFWETNIEASWNPRGYYDYYEPRMWGHVYKIPAFYTVEAYLATDSRKLLRLEVNGSITQSRKNNFIGYNTLLGPRFRINDRSTISFSLGWDNQSNDHGWVDTYYDSLMQPTIYFGTRDIKTISSVLGGKYIFSTKASITLRMRHYWSRVHYTGFYTLNNEGYLDRSDYNESHDINFNAFTSDAQFVWYFAPGSELSVVWKNAIYSSDNLIVNDYIENFRGTIKSPQTNSFSLRILYYLDYGYLRKLI